MRLATLLLILLPSAAFAQSGPGILERSSAFEAENERPTASFFTESPVAMLYLAPYSLSRLNLRVDLRQEQQARLMQLGDKALEGGFYADSYQRLNDNSIVWADARYVRGNRRNVRWNSTADYLLLYPYITADSLSGDLSTEEYAFGGGYARRWGRFNAAIRGDYRAGQEYRQVDPRPHNVVSDFTLRLGAGMEFSRYALSLDLQGRLYKQNQRISFYNPVNVVRELFMTGLGSYIPRYSGKSESTNVAYHGKQYAVAFQLLPLHTNGWYARADYERFTTERNYRPNNSIPVSRLQTQQGRANVAYRKDRWSLRAGANYEQRRGIELVADRNGQGAIVDEQAMYENNTWRIDAQTAVDWKHGSVRYTLQPQAEWWQSSASYLYPARRMTLSRLGATVRGMAEWLSPLWRVKATLGAGYYVSPRQSLSLNGLDQYMADPLIQTSKQLSSRALTAVAGVRAERRLQGNLACYAGIDWTPRFYDGGASEHNLSAAFGLLF